MKKIVLLISTLAVFALVGCYDWGKDSETDSETYQASLFNRVEIETANGTISASVTTDTMITVTLTRWADGINAHEHMLNIDVSVTKDTADSLLRIYVDIPINVGYNAGCDAKLVLPESLYIDLVSSNGAIDVDGHKVGMYLETSNASVDVQNTTGDAEIRTTNGAVETNDTKGYYKIESSNASVTVYDHEGNMEAVTSNGAIEAEVAMSKEDGICRFETSNAHIGVAVPDSVYADIYMRTSNADIDVEIPGIGDTNSDDDIFEGHMGQGTTPGDIYLVTSNGSVTLKKL